MNKIILFELNEVPLRVLDHYRKIRPSSWIAKNYKTFRKFETVSENRGHLSPWNTWPTVHRGVPNEKHYISDFNQELNIVDTEFPPIWRLLSDNRIKTGVFGSLHSYPVPSDLSNYSFYVPDVFAAGSECFPENIELFQEINLSLSRESARNVDKRIPYLQALKLLYKANDLGFKPATIWDIGSHLAQEKAHTWKVSRRRTYQSVLAFDVFYKLLVKTQPDFVTFFTNHVASNMHRFWAALFPDDYDNQKFDQNWISTYDKEIMFALDKTDAMLERLAQFIQRSPDYRLLITSSMGQEAVECEPLETQLYVVDRSKFMLLLGVDNTEEFESLPSMLPQFNFSVSERLAGPVEEKLNQFAINGIPLTYRTLKGRGFSVDLGHANLKNVEINLNGRTIPIEDSGFKNVVIEDKSSSTAYHIPQGHLFVYHPSFADTEFTQNQMPTAEIAPLILRNFGITPPEYMNKVNLHKF